MVCMSPRVTSSLIDKLPKTMILKLWNELKRCIEVSAIYVCSVIVTGFARRGSYTHTTSEHRFHHHSMDTSPDNRCVHVLWPTVHQSIFHEAAFCAMSEVHECPVCTQSSLLAVQQRLPGCEVSHDLVVILPTD